MTETNIIKFKGYNKLYKMASLEDYYTTDSSSEYSTSSSSSSDYSSSSSSSDSSSSKRYGSRYSRYPKYRQQQRQQQRQQFSHQNPSNLYINIIRSVTDSNQDVKITVKKNDRKSSTVFVRDNEFFGDGKIDTFNLKRFDIYKYVSNILDMVRTDYDNTKSGYKEIQFFIPMFPTIVIPKKFTNSEYNSVMSALNFYLNNF